MFTLPATEVLIAILEQWAMNETSCKRVCSVMHNLCLSWVMHHGAELSDELKYNLVWIMKDLLSSYTPEEQWTQMTQFITPWETTEVILTRMLEQQECCWFPFIAASITKVPSIHEAYFSSLENRVSSVITHPDWYLTVSPLLSIPSTFPHLSSLLSLIITAAATNQLSYDLSLSLLGLFATLDAKYGHSQADNTILVDVWISVCEAFTAVISKCDPESVWNVFGRNLEFLFQILFVLVDYDETHIRKNWDIIHTFLTLIHKVPISYSRNTVQALLTKACLVLECSKNVLISEKHEEEEDLISFGTTEEPKDPVEEQVPENEVISISEVSTDMRVLCDLALGGNLLYSSDVLTQLKSIECMRGLFNEILGKCEKVVQSFYTEADMRSKKRWNVDRKKDEALCGLCMNGR